MSQMKLIPADNMKDKLWGRRGTPEREAMETKLKEDVNAYIVGEAIRKARLAQNLTQENRFLVHFVLYRTYRQTLEIGKETAQCNNIPSKIKYNIIQRFGVKVFE